MLTLCVHLCKHKAMGKLKAETTSFVRVDTKIKKKVARKVKGKRGESIGGFYDKAALEMLEKGKIAKNEP